MAVKNISADLFKKFSKEYNIDNTRKCKPVVFRRDYMAQHNGTAYKVEKGTVGIIHGCWIASTGSCEDTVRFNMHVVLYTENVPSLSSTISVSIPFEITESSMLYVTECNTKETFSDLFSVISEDDELTKTMEKLDTLHKQYIYTTLHSSYESDKALLYFMSAILLPTIIGLITAFRHPYDMTIMQYVIMGFVLGVSAIMGLVIVNAMDNRDMFCYENSIFGKRKLNKIKNLFQNAETLGMERV